MTCFKVAITKSPHWVPRSDVNVQIQRLCRSGDLTEALRLLGTDDGVLQLCSEVRSLEGRKRAHFLARASGSGGDGMDSVLGQKSVLLYLKCGDLATARRVFDEMTQVSYVHVWTAPMSSYAKGDDLQEGVSPSRKMHSCGVQPDAYTISCVLKCIAGLGRCTIVDSIEDGEVVHGYLEKLGFVPFGSQCVVGNALTALYSRCGRNEDALQVFEGMPQQDAISWNSVISGCFSNGWHDRVFEVFSEMWYEVLEIDSVTILSVLPACTELVMSLLKK